MSFVKYWFNNYLFKQNPTKYCVAYSIKCIKKNIYFALLKTYNIHIFFYIHTYKHGIATPPGPSTFSFSMQTHFVNVLFSIMVCFPFQQWGGGGGETRPTWIYIYACVWVCDVCVCVCVWYNVAPRERMRL